MRVIKNALCFFVIICGIVSCLPSNEEAVKQIEFTDVVDNKQPYELVCKLGENMSYLDRYIYDFEILSDSTFIVVNGKSVYIYNNNGKQIKLIGDHGKGPGEYIFATSTYVSDNYIYVWCSSSMKLIVYNKDGTYIKNYKNAALGVHFVIENDSLAYAYGAGGRDLKLIKVLDLKTGNIISKFGQYSNADQALFCINSPGAVCMENNEILYSAPSELLIYSIKNDKQKAIFEIINSDFNVDLDVNLHDPEHSNWGFAKKNSVVTGVHSYNNNIYIVAETGKMAYGKEGKVLSSDTRKLSIFQVDSQYNPIKRTVYNRRDEFMTPHSFYKDHLFYISMDIELSTFTLSKMKL